MSLITDFKFALRSLARVKGLAITVVATLALGIGANAAIFSVVRGVLLRPLVNKDEDRLIYVRQSAPGLKQDNAKFSVPGDPRSSQPREDAVVDRRVLHHRLHDGRARRASRRARRRRQRLVLRRHGSSSGDGPVARRDGRRAAGRGRGGADTPLLDDVAEQRSVRDRKNHQAQRSIRDHRRRRRAVRAVSRPD